MIILSLKQESHFLFKGIIHTDFYYLEELNFLSIFLLLLANCKIISNHVRMFARLVFYDLFSKICSHIILTNNRKLTSLILIIIL